MLIHTSHLSALLEEIPDDAVCRPLSPDPLGFDAPSGKEWILWFIELVKNLEQTQKEMYDELEKIYMAEGMCHIVRPDGSSIISSMAGAGDVAYHMTKKVELERKLQEEIMRGINEKHE